MGSKQHDSRPGQDGFEGVWRALQERAIVLSATPPEHKFYVTTKGDEHGMRMVSLSCNYLDVAAACTEKLNSRDWDARLCRARRIIAPMQAVSA